MTQTTTAETGTDQAQLTEMYLRMQLIRRFDTKVVELFEQQLVRGSAHPYIGMEAVAVGVCSALGPNDYLTSTHRGHGHCIARGLDPKLMMAEILGRETGYCRGKGGSMHITAMEHGMLGADGIVGGSHGISVGAAYALQLQNRGGVVVCFFGDGAANEGSFHEACNLASVLKAPVVFVCENNQWALSTPSSSTINIDNVADRAAGYGFDGVVVDGNDVLQVHATAQAAVQHARSGNGPTLIEAKTYRMSPHSAFATGETSTAEELAEWRRKDPIDRLATHLGTLGVTADALAGYDTRAQQVIEEATTFALESSPPPAEQAFEDVYAPSTWTTPGRLA